jgi:UDP-GlcNAc:undecaprenyl-phosphate GlcNAc-1-phosphate transferase
VENELIGLFFIALVFGLIATPLFRLLATCLNIVDAPDGHLKRHSKPTPYLGGVAIYTSFWVISYYVFWPAENLWGLFLGTTIVVFIGLIDDLFLLTPIKKFIGQVLSGICLVWFGFCLDVELPFCIDKAVSVFWIVSLMNAMNLVDVMDGLATLISIFASLGLLYYAIYFNLHDLIVLLIILLGLLVAFFFYNSPRATIYLGDTGSMFLGGVVSAASLSITWGDLNKEYFLGYLIPIIILGVPIIEILSLIIIRRFKGIPFYNGSPDHFVHYLQGKKWSKELVLIYTATYSIILILFSALIATTKVNILTLLLISISLLASWIAIVFKNKK